MTLYVTSDRSMPDLGINTADFTSKLKHFKHVVLKPVEPSVSTLQQKHRKFSFWFQKRNSTNMTKLFISNKFQN